MKKLFSFLVAFGCAVSLNATTFNFDSSASVSQTIDGISVQLGRGITPLTRLRIHPMWA